MLLPGLVPAGLEEQEQNHSKVWLWALCGFPGKADAGQFPCPDISHLQSCPKSLEWLHSTLTSLCVLSFAELSRAGATSEVSDGAGLLCFLTGFLFAVMIWCCLMSGNTKFFTTAPSPRSVSTSPGHFLALAQILWFWLLCKVSSKPAAH